MNSRILQDMYEKWTDVFAVSQFIDHLLASQINRLYISSVTREQKEMLPLGANTDCPPPADLEQIELETPSVGGSATS